MDDSHPPELGILISGHNPQWAASLCTLSGAMALVLGGLIVLSSRQVTPPAIALFLIAGLLLAVSLILSVGLAFRRRYLRPTQSGFVYTTAAGERTFDDDDVMCVSLTTQDRYFAGTLSHQTRRFIMWVETGGVPESIICISHFRPGHSDSLSSFIVRIIRGLHDSARQAYADGERVEGDGWALERGQLWLKSKSLPSITNVSELAAAEVIEGYIHLWRRGDERPIGRIATQTANSHLLLLMLEELIPERQAESELASGSLGRLLFERGPGGNSLFVLGWLISISLGVGSFVMFVRGARMFGQLRRFRLRIGATLAGLLSFVTAVVLAMRQKGRFRRHVFGIQQRGMFGTRQLRFTEIGNMSYAATRAYVHGVYAGTTLTLNFVPIPSTGLKPIRFCTNVKNADPELDKLRDDVSVVIAKRMHDFWTQNGFCPWIQFLRFAKDGLEYQPLKFTGRKQAKLIPYSSIANFSIEESLFRIWSDEQQLPVVHEDTGQPNFYPGLVFLSEILQSLPRKDADLLPQVQTD